MSSINFSLKQTLAIGVGGNIDSPLGSPKSTLITARPVIEKTINKWVNKFSERKINNSSIDLKVSFCWSPLYRSQPLGGPANQPDFINAVLLVFGPNLAAVNPSEEVADNLLQEFNAIEKLFGRNREATEIHWGPRSLDIDLLTWGDFKINTSKLTLPHPRVIERDFVIIPLSETLKKNAAAPIQLPPEKGWKE